MRKKVLSVAIFCLVAGGILVLLLTRGDPPAQQTEGAPGLLASQEEGNSKLLPQAPQEPDPEIVGQELDRIFASTPDPGYAKRRHDAKKDDPYFDWRQPIDFHGQVVDENNVPVEGASVDFKWTDLSDSGTSSYHTESDAAGLFSLQNRAGKRLSVTVAKAGYYTTSDARQASFEYANPFEGRFTPDPEKPVVFRLRQKGQGTELLTSQTGMRSSLSLKPPSDGSPLLLDLLKREVAPSGQLVIAQQKPPYESWKQATNWSLQLTIPDGGFVEHDDEFPFLAPEEGYRSSIEFSFTKDVAPWEERLDRTYYIAFGQPRKFGRIRVKTDMSSPTVFLEYAINEDGSRYLEPK